jgi:hypothetical protein
MLRIFDSARAGAISIALVVFSIGISSGARSSSYDEDLAQAKVDDQQAVIDRKLYVAPAAKNFEPRGKGAILELKLTLEAKKIRRGEPIRYQFEIKNVGSDSYLFVELNRSFFKTGRLPSDTVRFRIKDPLGRINSVLSPLSGKPDTVREEIKISPELTEAEHATKIASLKHIGESAGRLMQRIAPGETLHTCGDITPRGHRNLNSTYRFDTVGTYELFVVLDSFSKNERTSNHARFEIVP